MGRKAIEKDPYGQWYEGDGIGKLRLEPHPSRSVFGSAICRSLATDAVFYSKGQEIGYARQQGTKTMPFVR